MPKIVGFYIARGAVHDIIFATLTANNLNRQLSTTGEKLMQNPPPNQQGNERAKTALGLDANLGAALGYPIGIIALIVFIIEKENRFARFHALQSLLCHIAWVVIIFVVFILFFVLGLILAVIGASSSAGGAIAGLLSILGILVWLAVIAAYIGGLLFAAYKAYSGSWFKLPFIGNMAEKIVNK
jgi:uncharacterized membrane protein